MTTCASSGSDALFEVLEALVVLGQRPAMRVVHDVEPSQNAIDLVVEAVEASRDLGELQPHFLFRRVGLELVFKVVLRRIARKLAFEIGLCCMAREVSSDPADLTLRRESTQVGLVRFGALQ